MKNILILCGGRSDEHEISLISAKCILDAIDRQLFQPVVVGISRKGVWYLEEEMTFYKGELRADKISLNETAPKVTLAPYLTPTDRGKIEADGKSVEFDVVFPILHGPFGEDGTLQGLLDIVGVPYVGSHCGAAWICMDKALTKTLCHQAGIKTAKFEWFSSMEDFRGRDSELRALGMPLFVKPARLGSSVGISKVNEFRELPTALATAFRYDTKVLVEKGIDGREIECSVLGNRIPKASLPGEIVVSKKIGWYSYEAKYLLQDGAETLAPAPLDPKTTKAVQDFVIHVFKVLECDGLARVDLFLERSTNDIYLNEVNTMPGFTPISMYPKMWAATGLGYKELITELIRLAFERAGKVS